MARKPRLYFPGAVYHVILRGNAGQDIFSRDKDRLRFYFFIEEGRERFNYLIHAFCLMRNHVHLVLQVGEISISRVLQNLSQRYTVWVNRQKGRTGHLFQGRYKAILIDADRYLLALVRYIHLNPIRAGIARVPEDYHWSSHRAYLGREQLPWLTTSTVLSQLSTKPSVARRKFQDFVLEGMKEGRREDLHKGVVDVRILGDESFTDEVLITTRQTVGRRSTLDEVLKAVSEIYSVQVEEILALGKQRRASEARGMVCWFVREAGHLSLTELSRRTNREISSLSQLSIRLIERSKANTDLEKQMVKLKSDLL
jgi:putative transposase